MDIGKIVSSPWVLGGGALLGLLFLLGNRSTPDTQTAYVSASNQAGLDYAAHSADVAASVAINANEARTTEHVAILSYLSNAMNVKADVDKTVATVNAGVVSNRLAASTAIALDKSAQGERYKEAYLSATTATTLGQQDYNKAIALAKEAGAVTVKTAQIAGDTAKTTTKTAADAQFWSGIWNGIFGLVPGILKL